MYVFLIVEKAIIIFYESNQGKKEITDTKDNANKMKSDNWIRRIDKKSILILHEFDNAPNTVAQLM